ncbi:endogenous retrovirus group K member 113 Pol protein-like protein [Turdus rufiventris]|nr:endogenous retrovirus group K member 113 Pol protein-like protein [Turdus rufiventris]
MEHPNLRNTETIRRRLSSPTRPAGSEQENPADGPCTNFAAYELDDTERTTLCSTRHQRLLLFYPPAQRRQGAVRLFHHLAEQPATQHMLSLENVTQRMINSPTICQVTVDRALAPVRQSNPTVTIKQYLDNILITAPSTSQEDWLVSTISKTLKINGFEIASAKIKKGPCITFLEVGISSSYITPPQIKIHRDIKMLHDVQQLVGSLQWLRNIVLIPPEVMDPLNDLLKGKNPWEQKILTPEAISSLSFIEHQMSVSMLTRWDSSTPVDLYVHFTKKGRVGLLAQGLPDKAQPIQWVVLGKLSHAFSPGIKCLSSLIMKGRKLALRHLGIEPTKIYLPFHKQLSVQSTTISEYLAMALAGFGGEIRYTAKPPWTQLAYGCRHRSPTKDNRQPTPHLQSNNLK